jgi:hypothetical protein
MYNRDNAEASGFAGLLGTKGYFERWNDRGIEPTHVFPFSVVPLINAIA